MHRVLWSAALAAVVAWPATASAQPVVDEFLNDFTKICVAPQIKAAEVGVRARAVGFVSPPDMFAKQFNFEEFAGAIVYWKTVEKGVLVAVTGSSPLPLDDEVTADICGVVSIPADRTAQPKLVASLGLTDPQASNGMTMFAYDEQNGKRTPIKGSLSLGRAMEAGRLRMIVSGEEEMDGEKASMLLMMTPRPK